MEQYLVSIVIPTYNRAKYISNAIKSAVEQDFHSFEVIICDNDSNDNTEEIVRTYIEEYPEINIQYIRHINNIGPVRNWFSGIYAAKGKYIKILFSDDVLYPNCLKDLVEGLDGTNYAFAYGMVDDNWQGSSITSFKRYRPGCEATIEEYIGSFFSAYMANEIYPNSPCAALLRKEVLIQIPIEEFQDCLGLDTLNSGIGPDWIMFFYSYVLVSKKAKYVNRKIAAFQGHNTSITVTSGLEKLDNHNFATFLKFYHIMKNNPPIAKIIENYFDRMAALPAYFKRPVQRLNLLTKSGYYNPQKKNGFIPLAGLAFFFTRKFYSSTEFRLNKYFRSTKPSL